MIKNTKPQYPTKEEILAELYEPKQKEYDTVKKWKATFFNKTWSKLNNAERHKTLTELIFAVCQSREENWPKYDPNGEEWSYAPLTKIITGNKDNPSIISTLHELGHHFYGNSEKTACRYAIGIFKMCFPLAYEKLEWSGHMLIVPKKEENAEKK